MYLELVNVSLKRKDRRVPLEVLASVKTTIERQQELHDADRRTRG